MHQSQRVLFSQIALDELLVAISTVLEQKLKCLHSPANEDELLTRKETANLLGISLNTLHTYTLEGKIPGYRIGTRIRYKRSVLENSLATIKPTSR